jgi:hypothetical protein
VTLSARSANCTVINAYRWSADTAPIWNGFTAPSTPGNRDASLTRSATLAWFAGVLSCEPSCVDTTIVPVAPLAAGNSRCSASIARCDSVPGIVKSLEVAPLNATAPTPSAPSASSQITTTRPRRRYEARPSRYSRVAMMFFPLNGVL